jgi:hypothetical protein
MHVDKGKCQDKAVRYTGDVAVVAYNLTDKCQLPTTPFEDTNQTMDSTRVRRRSTATKTRSRSKLPRLNTREPVQVEKRDSSSVTAVLLGIFQMLLISTLISIVFVSFAILADKTWLPRLCDQTVVKDASVTLGQFIQIDICSTSLAEHGPQPDRTPPALAIIQKGQSIGESLKDFVESYADSSFHWEANHYIQRSSLRSTTADDAKLYHALQTDLSKTLEKYATFVQGDLVRAVTYTKYEHSEAAGLITRLIQGAERNGPRRCYFFQHWAYDLPLVGGWFSRSFSATNLLAQLDLMNSKLVPQFGRIYRDSGLLMKDLARLTNSLDLAKERAQGDDTLVADIERHTHDLSRLSVVLDAVRGQSTELGEGFVALLKMTKRHRCLGLSQEDSELATEGLEEMQASIHEVEARWKEEAGIGDGTGIGTVTLVEID